ncbi:MAG: universal stress protein [Rhodobacterales bacterium]|nr:MAG: universal stress protein [Rhodobacterales bacterium]
MSTVLCAVDISNKHRDDKVLKQAAQLATLENAQLDVITVVPDFGMTMVGMFFEEGHQKKALVEAKSRLKALVTEVLGAEADTKIRHIVTTGNAYEEILKVAKKDGAYLIVIGAHKDSVSDYLLGPNAARVVRHSNCSVYVVR